ncbi:MAG: calcium-translocating P-type ATPase, PMCA-type, partial [Alistipes sp.]|nr:calcium-translocating P-type ATPase, PMCA-type [Alistipes sp.]
LSLGIACFDGEFTETIGILCAIVLATGVGFLFEWDAMRRFRRLNRVNDQEPVKVLRSGTIREIPRCEVVVGDRVFIESGEQIPADGELLEAVSLRLNESSLTGEMECSKSVDPAHFDPEATYPSNEVMRGPTVVDGYGSFVVCRVGDQTEAGRVTEQSTIESGEETPLHRQLQRLSTLIGRVGFLLAGAIFITLLTKAFLFEGLLSADWMTLSRELLEIVMISVAILVMAVPEGLPMSITLSLAMSMRRMLKTNNLVRKMHACETMGAVTVICTDKTGTLTRNQMSVAEMVRLERDEEPRLGEALACNTTAFLSAEGTVIGNPTEGALLLWLKDEGVDYQSLREGVRIVDRITFSTQWKYMATLVERADGERYLAVKGAPEVVRAMCAEGAEARELDTRLKDFQSRAMRTLAVAIRQTTAPDCRTALEEGPLALIAVDASEDPVREEVLQAVGRCLGAGIAIKVVTGDTAVTAIEIARRIGLWNPEQDGERNHLTGPEFAALSDEEALERVGELKILSRARPLDKQRLVRLLQQRGEVVAVTGDGTNDAPALNFAHVGLSMGTGTSVAKDASDITLLDDSFSSIATAVLWGRSLYRNIQRFLLFQLTINFTAILIVFFGAIFGEELPLTVVQILWVNLIMDTFAAMAMASLPPSEEVMREAPRSREAFIITRPMWGALLGYGLLFVAVLLGMFGYWLWTQGELTLEQMTLFFTTFVFLQFWNMFNARGFGLRQSAFRGLGSCRTFLWVLLLIGLGQVAIVEWGGAIFRTTPLEGMQWLALVGLTSLVAVGGEILRRLRRG